MNITKVKMAIGNLEDAERDLGDERDANPESELSSLKLKLMRIAEAAREGLEAILHDDVVTPCKPLHSVDNCKHCGHQLVVDITRGARFPVWDCPKCKAYWTWVFPPT
jgi:hypothetical protein